MSGPCDTTLPRLSNWCFKDFRPHNTTSFVPNMPFGKQQSNIYTSAAKKNDQPSSPPVPSSLIIRRVTLNPSKMIVFVKELVAEIIYFLFFYGSILSCNIKKEDGKKENYDGLLNMIVKTGKKFLLFNQCVIKSCIAKSNGKI